MFFYLVQCQPVVAWHFFLSQNFSIVSPLPDWLCLFVVELITDENMCTRKTQRKHWFALQIAPKVGAGSTPRTGTCVTWLVHMWDVTLCVQLFSSNSHWLALVQHLGLVYAWHDSFTCVTCRCQMFPRTGAGSTYGTGARVTWLFHDVSRIVWYDSFIFMTWLVHRCDMTHSYVWHGLFATYQMCFLGGGLYGLWDIEFMLPKQVNTVKHTRTYTHTHTHTLSLFGVVSTGCEA